MILYIVLVKLIILCITPTIESAQDSVKISKAQEERYSWRPSTLAIEPKDLGEILTANPQLESLCPNASRRFQNSFTKFLVKLNCQSISGKGLDIFNITHETGIVTNLQLEIGLHDFELLNQTLHQIRSLNKVKDTDKDEELFQVSLSFVATEPYKNLLQTTLSLTSVYKNIITLVLSDFGSNLLGPMDFPAVQTVLETCQKYSRAGNFTCGLIFDQRICRFTPSFFFSLRNIRVPIFFSGMSVHPHNIYRQMQIFGITCGSTFIQYGMHISGVILYGETTVNETHFSIPHGHKLDFPKPFDIVTTINYQSRQSYEACDDLEFRNFSHSSNIRASSVLLHIRAEDLLHILQNDENFTLNESAKGETFLGTFVRLFVLFDGTTKDKDYEQMTEIFNAVADRMAKLSKQTYLPLLSLWIAFTPKGNIQEELVEISALVKNMNEKVPGTVAMIVLNYKYLRVDKQAFPLVKRDVETCNEMQVEQSWKCAYIFQRKNCFNNNKPLKRLPFSYKTIVFILGESPTCLLRLRQILRVANFDPVGKPKYRIQLDLGSNKFSYNATWLFFSETRPVPYVLPTWRTDLGNSSNQHQHSLSDAAWRNSPVQFQGRTVGFTVDLDQISSFPESYDRILVVKFPEARELPENTIRPNELGKIYRKLGQGSESGTYLYLEISNRDVNQLVTDTLRETISIIRENVQTDKIWVIYDWLYCFDSKNCNLNYTDPTILTEYYNEHLITLKETVAHVLNVFGETRMGATIDFSLLKALREQTRRLYSGNKDGTSFNATLLYQTFKQFHKVFYPFEIDFDTILNKNAYVAAHESIKHLEEVDTHFEFTFALEDFELSIELVFIVKVFGCPEFKTSSEAGKLVLYLQILTNWAKEMDHVVVIDTAFVPDELKNCSIRQHFLRSPQCPCGWWTGYYETGEIRSQFTIAQELYNMEQTKKRQNPPPVKEHVFEASSLAISVIIVLSLGFVVAMLYALQRRQRFLPTQVLRHLLGERGRSHLGREIINRSDMKLKSKTFIGSGSSGTKIYKCPLKTNGFTREVAIKIFKCTDDLPVTPQNIRLLHRLVSEASLLSTLEHNVNIVQYFGACTTNIKQGEFIFAMEYCRNGSIEAYLKEHKPSGMGVMSTLLVSQNEYEGGHLSFPRLDKWCVDVASGLVYLSAQQIVHGDIAARNVLLDRNMVAKLADFGLSRKLHEDISDENSFEGEALPWRWMSPESLKLNVYNEKTDIWMFGVFVWELSTLGEVPYGGLSWSELFPSMLENGLRLEVGNSLLKHVSDVVHQCWETDADKRPTFSSCRKSLLKVQSF